MLAAPAAPCRHALSHLVLCPCAGKVTSHRGHIQIQIGSSWGKVEHIKGQEIPALLPHSPATSISLPERLYGGLLLRQAGERAEAFLLRGSEAEPVAALHAHYVETERAAACRHVTPFSSPEVIVTHACT